MVTTSKQGRAALPIAQIYPPEYRDALLEVQYWPGDQREARIDQITHELVILGFCRRRTDDSGVRHGQR